MGLIIPHPLSSPQHSSKLPATVRGAGAVSLHCAGLGRVISHISCPAISRSALPSARPSCFYTPLLAEADIFYGDLKQVRGLKRRQLWELNQILRSTYHCHTRHPVSCLTMSPMPGQVVMHEYDGRRVCAGTVAWLHHNTGVMAEGHQQQQQGWSQ